MATTFTETSLATTYKDDFRDSDNYHRILFNTGVGLQARELTQLQTILQSQIERFGNNVFKEGAVVKPGGVNINPQYEFIKLDVTDPSHVLPDDITTLVGKTVTGQTSSIVATILEVVAAEGSDPATLYVKYTSTSSAQGSTDVVTQRMSGNEVMDVSDGTDLKVKLSTIADPSTGKGTQVTALGGIYYARGNFVLTQDQSKIISKYTDTPDTDIGFKTVEDVVTASDNNALYDNQGSVPNVSAPGADRYRITLTIAERSEMTSSDNFVHVATIKKGQIYSAVATTNSYNIPNELIAKRIEENSGDYIVKPFSARFDLDSQNTHLLLNVSDGVAVVRGFRSIVTKPSTFRITKPAVTTTVNNEPVGATHGAYVFVDVAHSGLGKTKGIPNFNQLEEMNLKSAVTHGGDTIGTARVKAITKSGTNLKMHLIDINVNSGKVFRDVKSIGTSTSNFFNITLENSKGVLKEPYEKYNFFSLPNPRPTALSDLIYTAQRKGPLLSANGSGVVTLTGLTAPGEIYTRTDDFVYAKADSDVSAASPSYSLTPSADAPTGGTANFGTAADVATISSSSNIELAAFVSKTQTTPKTKTLTNMTLTNTVESDGAGFKFINMKRADIYEVDEIVNASDSNESYATRFIVDNGQRPSHYDVGRLILRSGQSAPAGSVSMKYKFFDPTGGGDYFSVNSYAGQVDYDKIPNYNLGGGRLVNLRDVIDFRSVSDSAGNFNTSGATMLETPQDGSTITADVTYNLATPAKLVIDKNSKLDFVFGAPGFNPILPVTPDGSLPLYDIIMNPGVLNDSDVSLSKYNFKRFTMKDIGKLENRVERLEETTTLNLLETDTKYLQVLDSSGNDRTKSGFFVDAFKDHRGAEMSVPYEYRASTDFTNRVVRPMTRHDQIRLIYDSAGSVTANGGLHKVIKKGDNVYIAHDEVEYINQITASKAVKINPFAVTVYEGTITLSPSSDEWRDVERVPDKIIQGGTLVSPIPTYQFNDHIANWSGNSGKDAVPAVATGETLLNIVNDRIIETTTANFMRSRKVYFRAEGLRPNTQVFTFLDGVNITSLTNGGGGPTLFQHYSDTDSDFGNTLSDITIHPSGSSTLITDANGTVSGSFIVPNNDTTRIRTGTREFKVLDISVDKETDAAAMASTNYTSQGFLDTKQATYESTRIIVQTGGLISYNEGGDHKSPVTDDWGVSLAVATVSLGLIDQQFSNYAIDMMGLNYYDPAPKTHNQGVYSNMINTVNNSRRSKIGTVPTYTNNNQDDGPGGGMNGDEHGYTDDNGYGVACLLEDMLVMLNGVLSTVVNVKVGDIVSGSLVTEVMQKHMRNAYYIVNDELKITNDHPVLTNLGWKRTEEVEVGDYINGVKVETIDFIEKIIPTVYIGTTNESFDVYCNNNIYTVHGQYKQLLKKAS